MCSFFCINVCFLLLSLNFKKASYVSLSLFYFSVKSKKNVFQRCSALYEFTHHKYPPLADRNQEVESINHEKEQDAHVERT